MALPCAPVFSFHRCRACMGAKAYPFLRTAFGARTRFCGPHWQPISSRLAADWQPAGADWRPHRQPHGQPYCRPYRPPYCPHYCPPNCRPSCRHTVHLAGQSQTRAWHRSGAQSAPAACDAARTVPVSASCERRPMPRGVPCVPVSAYTTSVESRLSDASTSRHRRAEAARSRLGIKRWCRPRRHRRATRRRWSPMPAANRRRPPCARPPPPWPRAG